ncbi:MAG: DUF47 family protein [bacterium]|nr:DUF47 family protein [bacterium]
MKFNFMPKNEKFQDIFNRASKNVVDAAKSFKLLMIKWDSNSELFEKIRDFEHEGDLIRHELVDKLNHTFITPFDREDIYELSGRLDDIVDMIQACTDRMQIYNLDFSKNEGMLQLAEIVEKTTISLDRAISEMHDEKKKRRTYDYCIEVNQYENEGDILVRKLLKNLFADRSKISSLEVILFKEVYEFAESIIDKCENVAHTIEGIVVKNC